MHVKFKERAPAVLLDVSIAVRVTSDVIMVIYIALERHYNCGKQEKTRHCK